MNLPAQKLWYTPEDYLDLERDADTRHQYVDGEIFAMAGASREHVTVSLNVASLLKSRLRGGPCRAFIADMKLRVEAANAFYYPDVFVTCDRRDLAAWDVMHHPTLVVEVLSPSTASFDRGLKFSHYRSLESLQEYLLIDPNARTTELYRRTPQGWQRQDPEQDAVHLQSLGVSLALTDLFEDLDPAQAV
jgi:Uma2 family endonuclease